MNGFISIKIDNVKIAGFNTFQNDGYMDVIKFLLRDAGNDGTLYLSTSIDVPNPLDALSSRLNCCSKSVSGVKDENYPYYKKENTKVIAQGDLVGSWSDIHLRGLDSKRIAGRLIGGTMIGRGYKHVAHDQTRTLTEAQFYHDAGYTGSAEVDDKPVIGGTPTNQRGAAYCIRIHATGEEAVGVATYDIVKYPYSSSSVFVTPNAPYMPLYPGYQITKAGGDVLWAVANTGVSSGQLLNGSQTLLLNDDIGNSTLSYPADAAQDPADPNIFWIASAGVINTPKYFAQLHSLLYSPLASPPVISVAATYDYTDIGNGLTDATLFRAVRIDPANGDIYLGTDTGVYKYDGTVWSQLANLTTVDVLWRGMEIFGTTLYVVNAATEDLIKYDLATSTITATLNTTTTPALYAAFPTQAGTPTQIGNPLAIDSIGDVWIAYQTNASGISRLSADGTTITHWNSTNMTISTAVANSSGITNKVDCFNYGQFTCIAIDRYDRPIAIASSAGVVHVFENNQWNWYQNKSAYGSNSPLAFSEDNLALVGYSWYGYYLRPQAVPVTLGWNSVSSAWEPNNTTKKVTHTGSEAFIDGMTIQFPTGKNYTDTDWFSFAAGPGIVKDNLQELTVRYSWYSAELIQVVNEGHTVPVDPGPYTAVINKAPTGTDSDPEWLIAEDSEIENWTVIISGVEATLQAVVPTQAGEVQVASDGTLTFHLGDAGSAVTVSYYYLRR